MIQLQTFIINNKRDITLFVLLFLVSSISFALGYLYAKESIITPIIIEKNSEL